MPGIRRLRAAATVGVLAAVTFGIWSGVRPAAARAGSAPTIGPVQISALGRPGLCWEAGGNGSVVTLEHCDAAVQGQQWSLTGNGVVMNGNGYCLEVQPGHAVGQALYIDFAGECPRGPGLRGQGLALPGRPAGQHRARRRDQHRDRRLRRRRRPAVARDRDRDPRPSPWRPALEHRVQLRHPGTRRRKPRGGQRCSGRRVRRLGDRRQRRVRPDGLWGNRYPELVAAPSRRPDVTGLRVTRGVPGGAVTYGR